MSCDFKVGDEVVYAGHIPPDYVKPWVPRPEKDRVYVVGAVGISGDQRYVLIYPVGLEWISPSGVRGGYIAKRWRKVQRRDLGEWLKTNVGDTDHIDRSVRERVGV